MENLSLLIPNLSHFILKKKILLAPCTLYKLFFSSSSESLFFRENVNKTSPDTSWTLVISWDSLQQPLTDFQLGLHEGTVMMITTKA